MVAPRASTLRWHDRLIGIELFCPECPSILGSRLRVENAVTDYPLNPGFPIPDLALNPGPLGFIARCDQCGFRVEMHGDRLPTVAMLLVAAADMAREDTDGSPYGGSDA